MKITALEIRQKTFEKEFRGVNKSEVSAFLLSLSQAWEQMVEKNKELKLKLEYSEKEVQKLREVENSLFKTLQTAETTGANMVEQANKSAELLMKETKMKAEQLYNDAQKKSDNIVAEMQNEIRVLEKEYREIENLKDNLLREIKSIASDSIERVNKVSSDKKDLNSIKNKAQNVPHELRKAEKIEAVKAPKIEAPKPQEQNTDKFKKESSTSPIQFEQPIKEESKIISTESPDKPSTSFFDEITE